MNERILELFELTKSQKDPFEKARLINQLKKENGLSLIEISRSIDIKPSYICHILRLLKCPDLIVDGYYSHVVSISHLFIISRLKDEQSMILAYEKVLNDNLTVIQTEELIRLMLFQIKSEGEYLSEDKKNQLSEPLKKRKIEAKILQTRTKGKITLEIQGSLSHTTQEITDILTDLSSKQESLDFEDKKS